MQWGDYYKALLPTVTHVGLSSLTLSLGLLHNLLVATMVVHEILKYET